MVFCNECGVYVSHISSHKKSLYHKSKCLLNSEFQNVHIIASAFKNRIVSYRINPDTEDIITAPEIFLNNICATVNELIRKSLSKHNALKVNMELFVSYYLPKNNEKSIKSFNVQFTTVFHNTDLPSFYKEFCEKLISKCSEFEQSESGWAIESVNYLELNINKYNPLRAGTYIKLPNKIQNTKSCININNVNDKKCFLWSIIAHMYPAKRNPNRVTSYPHYENILNISGMKFPVSLSDIKLFEENNPNISVNVYGLEKNCDVSGPLYKTAHRKLTHVNLLLVQNHSQNHYCLIKNFEKLIHKQLTKHRSKIFLCDECFVYFESQEKLYGHICARVKTVLPPSGSKLSFSHFERTRNIPIVIYGDFESLLKEYSDKNKSQHVEGIQIHEATCFAYYICCKSRPSLNKFVSYRGPDCAKAFVETLCNDVMELHQILSTNVDMVSLTENQKKTHESATACHLCKKAFIKGDIICADHDHFTGYYLGASHNACNLNATICKFIPIIFHNLTGYDCHLFINELSAIVGRINLIPKTKEKYISFTKFIPVNAKNAAQLKFIDSFNFLSCGLDNLAKTLHPDDFINLKHFYPDKKSFDLLRRKGIYCYDYVNSFERYNDMCLPERNCFFNKMTSEEISEKDYEHAKTIWKEFQIQDLGQYTDLYLKCDVLLLCDVFEKFRSMSLTHYNLDPCHYVSSPSLSWDAMLLYTKIELDMISDVEIYQMIEKGIRGGLAQCSLRHSKANNKYLSDYNKNELDSYLVYLDCVNLYGYAMMKCLPIKNFKFLTDDECIRLKENIKFISDNNNQGYILEVDLEYPTEIHDLHSELPFAPEKYIPPNGKCEKLIANLHNKCQYVIHYTHLKECLKHGLKLLKIHRVLVFDQKEFLKPYIELNTALRQNSSSDFERDFFKKQNNCIFGKTIENKRNQIDVKLVNVWKDVSNRTNKICGAEKYISAPNFKNLSIFSENLVAIQLQQSKIILDRPIYIGFTVLELAKTHLYKFHYSVMKKMYEENIQLCYTDTDSLLYLIKTEDFYKDMKGSLQYFDTSNFSDNNLYTIPRANAKLPGYFKDELGGKVISEFTGLRAKLYCIDTETSSIKKAKGAKKSVTKNLTMEKFKRCLFKNVDIRDDMYVIKSKNHRVFTQRLNKLVLNKSDDKRQIFKNTVNTLPWGHYANIL